MGLLNWERVTGLWGDLFDPDEKTDWGRVRENFKAGGSQAWNGLLSVYAGAMSLNQAFDDDFSFRAALDNYRRAAGQFGSALGSTGTAVSDIPVLRQVFGTIDWAQQEFVKRPLSTSWLVAGDVHAGQTDFNRFFDRERWRQAYNSTTYVTPGQAFMYMAMSESQAALRDFGGVNWDEAERRDILRANPHLGIVVQDPAKLDPRNREQRQLYKDNPYLKYTSGTLDAGVTMFADPSIVLGRLGVAGKAKFWSKEMNAAAIAKGQHVKFMDTNAYQKKKQFIAEAANPDIVARTVFNNKYDGDLISNLLWSVAKDQQRYELYGGKADLYDLTWFALYGDRQAWEVLTNEAPRIAQVVGRQYANYTIGNLAKQYGLGDKAVDRQWEALKETEVEAFVDSMANGHGAWGRLGEGVKSGGLLTDQAAPRLRMSSKWRVGVHSAFRNGPATKLGFWARRSQHILPTSRTGRMLDLNDMNGARLLRVNLEHSRLTDDEIGRWVSVYARASSPASRFAIYNAAENAALAKHLSQYGVNPKTMDQTLAMVNTWRTGNRQILGSSRRFMSRDVRNLAKKRIEEGKHREGKDLDDLANEIEAAEKRGDWPAVHAIPDEDTGVALIPADTDISTTGPVMVSQQADVVPMQDWNVLENALWWGTKGGFGKRAYQTIDGGRALLDSLMSVWKIAAILRPGYVWRALSDEFGRAWSVMGTARGFMGSVAATKDGPKFLGNLIASRVSRARAFQATTIDLDGELVDEIPTAAKGSLASDARFDPAAAVHDGMVYTSFERAFADGIVPVDDLVERIEAHGQVGTLPGWLGQVYRDRHVGKAYQAKGKEDQAALDKMYRRHLVDAALTSVGRDFYIEPSSQQSILNALVDQGTTGPAGKKPKKPGQVSQGLIIDPFTGLSPKLKWDKVPDNYTMSSSKVITAGKDGRFDIDNIYDYVADNVDELLQPGRMLSGYARPDGTIVLSVATVNKESAKKLNIKPSAGIRTRLPLDKGGQGRLFRDSGMADLRISLRNGQSVVIKGAFEDQAGDLFRKQVSSRGVEDAWVDHMTDIEFARLAAKSGRWVDVAPTDRRAYKQAWERAVNLQIANDPVARQFVAGKSFDDVMAWLNNTSAGRAYNAKMGPWRSEYVKQARAVEAMVELYVPRVDGKAEASAELAKKVLAGKATLEDLETVKALDDMPNVHGASIEYATRNSVAMDWIRRRVDTAFKWLSDIPSDLFVRYPFAAERYRMHAQELLRARSHQLQGKTLSQADLESVERQARQRSLMDVKKYLYESTASLDLAKAFRLLVPFGSAIGDSTVKWGVVLREKPWVANQIWKLWTVPEKSGLIYDENGNHLRMEDGKEVWYSVNPETGEETRLDGHAPKTKRIVFRLPSFGLEYAKDMSPVARMDKNVFHTFLDMPTFGPLVTVPVNEFTLDHPEFADNKFVRAFILPYGASSDVKVPAMPGNVRSFWDKFVDDDGATAQNQAMAIYETELVRYAQGQRADKPTFKEARERAADMRSLRFGWKMAGVSAQFTGTYQPYIDYYHRLQTQASEELRKAERGLPAQPFDPDLRFYDSVGEEFFELTARMTQNYMGLRATKGAFYAHKRHRELMERHPELASLIAGAEGAGEFSRTVYEAQRQTEVRPGSGKMMREPLSPDESWEDLQRRRGWIEYTKFMDAVHADMKRLGVDSLEQKAAAKLKAARERWLKERQFVDSPHGGTVLNPWYQEFASFDTSRMTGRLHSLRQIVQDKDLQGREDMKGLVEYLHARDQFKRYMERRKFKTLDSEKAKSLRLQWKSAVFQLKDRNLSFAQLYDRWLTQDESLEAD